MNIVFRHATDKAFVDWCRKSQEIIDNGIASYKNSDDADPYPHNVTNVGKVKMLLSSMGFDADVFGSGNKCLLQDI